MHIRTVSLTIVTVAALTAGCSSDSEPAAETAAATEAPVETEAADAPATDASDGPSIQIEGFAFSSLDPVAPGTEISVENLDGALHTLTADDGSFNTEGLAGGASTTIVAPSAPGDYTFVCNIHPSMTGTLTVSG